MDKETLVLSLIDKLLNNSTSNNEVKKEDSESIFL